MLPSYGLIARRVWSDARVPGTRGNRPAPIVVTAERRRRIDGNPEKWYAGRYQPDAHRVTLYAPEIQDKQDALGTLLHELSHALLAPSTGHTVAFKYTLALLEHLYGRDSEGTAWHDSKFSAPVCTGWVSSESGRGYIACPLGKA